MIVPNDSPSSSPAVKSTVRAATPARRQSLPDIVAAELERMIVEDKLEPGTSLPTEIALMEQFTVSRTVVREAARVLMQKGLVDVRPGRGMTVRPVSVERLAQEFTLLLRTGRAEVGQLAQLRELLEPAIAAEAARARTDSDLAELADIILKGERTLDEPQEFIKADIAFHEGVARASGNPFFLLVTAPLGALLHETYVNNLEYVSYEHHTQREHQAILDAITAGNADAASAETLKHLSRVHDSLIRMLHDRNHSAS